MNRTGFMIRLESHLDVLSESEKAEILFDMNEHFDIAESQGKTDDEIIQALGSPEEIAAQYIPEKIDGEQESAPIADQQSSQTQRIPETQVNDKSVGKIVLAIVVVFFSITTILPIIFSFAMTIISLIISGGGIVIGGLAGAFSSIINSVIPQTESWLPFGNAANILFSISTICFGFLWSVVWIYIWTKSWKLIKKYFTFLINIIKLK